MKTKYYLVFLVLLLSLFTNNCLFAQRCLSFNYDADGNRIKRSVMTNCYEIKDFEEVQENEYVTDISVYPNPTDGSFKIKLTEDVFNENSHCLIYDLNGVLKTESFLSEETDIDIGDMPDGVYLLRIVCGDETFSKIILKH